MVSPSGGATGGRRGARLDLQGAHQPPDGEPLPRWIPCDNCDEWWCTVHAQHVFECPCPPIDELNYDPYTERGP